MQPAQVPEIETNAQRLARVIASFRDDPLGFVLFNFQWGVGKLEAFKGPRTWQAKYLKKLGKEIVKRGFDGIKAVAPVRMGTASGHGIGKSTLVAWLIIFIMSTRPECRGVVTANTNAQLRSRTWTELGKWHALALNKDWFTHTNSQSNLSFYANEDPKNWRFEGQTCAEQNSEAFAGLHVINSSAVFIFDEASAVPNKIHEVSEGGLTEGEPFKFEFGNATRNSGAFFDIFHKLRHRWICHQIDSRDVEGTNKELIDEWVNDYGPDSDFVRVRVAGKFPRASSMQFISNEIVTGAQERKPEHEPYAPILIGVDVARFGDDQTVLTTRCGRMTDIVPKRKFRNLDAVQVAAQVVDMWNEIQLLGRTPSAIFVEGPGVGGGVIDELRRMKMKTVFEVQPGGDADSREYFNKRSEMWGKMRDWLKGGCIDPTDSELERELTTIEYGFDGRGNRIQLEKVEDVKRRDLPSPDNATALALTFAYNIVSEEQASNSPHVRPPVPKAQRQSYNPIRRKKSA